MTEINIILDTKFEELSETTLKNDKEFFYENLNQDFDIYTLNKYSKYIIPYNQILNDLLINDDYLDYENELFNIDNINIKKLILKKVLIFYNPIIKKTIDIKKTNIIDKFAINLNYPINAKILSKKNKNLTRRISPESYFLIHGFYNSNILSNSNLPFKLNKFKYIHELIFKLFKPIKNININLDKLKYHNYGVFDITTIDNNILKELYNIYLNYYFSYLNNNILINSKIYYSLYNLATFQTNNLLYKDQTKLVNNNYSKNYISNFNKFLSYKINDYFNNHSYYSFKSDNLLTLYEDILIYSIDKDSIQNKIKNIILSIQNQKEYNNNKKIIDQYNLKYIQLEYLTRKRFPNLFNPNSKEVLFYKHKLFNLDDLPKKYKEIILIDYKKLQNYRNENINNKCIHKNLIHELNFTNNKYPIVQELNKLIQGNSVQTNEYYKCILCSYNLICPHILEYYNLLFSKKKNNDDGNDFSIRQHLINKYMTNAKINMIYYCKVCGEELGKSLDLEQNIEYKDKIKLNTSEYSDSTLELVRNNTMHIVYSYIIFTELNINITKKYLINYIFTNILTNINLIEKSLRKAKIYNEEQITNLIDFNSIIFIYSTLIFIMTKYPFISFIQNSKKTYYGNNDNIIITAGKNATYSNIIIPKKIEIKSNKDLLNLIKLRFKEAHDIIISSNNILLFKLKYNKQHEKIKELLLKTYAIVAKNDQMTLTDKSEKLSNKTLLNNSSIYNYFYLIKSIYPLKSMSSFKPSLPILNFNSQLFTTNNQKIDFNNYENILNLSNINSNKIDNLFKDFNSPIINEQIFDKLLTNKKIDNYNDYKILSFNLFYYHIKYELYNLPIFEYIYTDQDSDNSLNYTKFILNNIYLDKLKIENENKDNKYIYDYIKLSQLIKRYEIDLINKNIQYHLYPFSLIKLNNSRYFYYKNIHLNIYFCSKDGFPHTFNIYLYLDNDKKQIEIDKKQIDKNIDNISKLQFIDYKCSKCNNEKNKLLTSKVSNSDILQLINDNNDKNGFFNLYLNVCPITINNKISHQDDIQFHNFINKDNEIQCNICKIKYIDLINKNNDIYFKYMKEYNDYKLKKQLVFNNQLQIIKERNDIQYNTDIKTIYQDSLLKLNILSNVSSKDIISIINDIDFDTILVNFTKQFSNYNGTPLKIIFLQKLGLTEGYEYNETVFNNITNIYNLLRINKLLSYFRSIIIYYNLLKNSNNLSKHYDIEFFNVINKLLENKTLKNKFDKFLPNIKYNISDLITALKLQYDNEYVTKFLIKLIFQFILDLDNINKSKFDNELDLFIQFILFKILKFDELFTNFNYAQLKQMFNEDKFDYNQLQQENEEFNDEDDDDLFGYNDLNIQFEDEDPIDE